jgi:exopolysaccharide/PEP-CTERM locus tyrosine autokinase
MGTIEQAAKRLEQLRKAGVVDDGTPPAAEPIAAAEPLPLRAVRELEARAAAAEPARPAAPLAAATALSAAANAEPAIDPVAVPAAAAAVPARPRAAVTATIDLARLSVAGYITPNAPRSRLAEEFRVIKRPLITNARTRPAGSLANANRIMITSSVQGEGKTYVSINLAMSIAMEMDTNVLLVDADASRPAVLERLGLPPAKGLLDLLADPTIAPESLVLQTNVPRLAVLPAGAPQAQATEMLASDAMSRLVEHLGAQDPRRIVLFDTPPLLAASEARVLAAHMGQVVLVIAADDTPQGTVAEGLAAVENCPAVLTLLNRTAPGDSSRYYGSYGSHAH